MRRIRVVWETTELFEAIVEIPDDSNEDLWDGDNGTLVELEEGDNVDVTGNGAWQGTVRNVTTVEEA